MKALTPKNLTKPQIKAIKWLPADGSFLPIRNGPYQAITCLFNCSYSGHLVRISNAKIPGTTSSYMIAALAPSGQDMRKQIEAEERP